jgi:transmembrane sensor
MQSRKAQLNRIAPRRIRAQAAVWVTELHGPNRNLSVEEKVRRWIAADPRHAAAFELATEAWQRSGDLPAHIPQQTLAAARSRTRSRLLGASLAGAAVLCGLLVASAYYLAGRTLVTSAAEQRTVELVDGTQVTLNANTRVRLQYDDRLRKVTLSRGEAFFHVAKLASKPFVVVAGNRKVIALGTSFLVRCEDPNGSRFAVTLIEGRVAVEPIEGPDLMPDHVAADEAAQRAPDAGIHGTSSDALNLKVLNRGERLRYAGDAPGVVDAPSIDKITAWQRGLLIFDNASLSDAAAEFNRYGSLKISVTGAAANLRVSGVFRLGDALSFAQAMSLGYGLNVVKRSEDIIVSDKVHDLK